MSSEITDMQQSVCNRFGVAFVAAPALMKVGVALNLKDGIYPINGLRHPLQGDTTGWYLWAGSELSTAPDFFKPLHVEHLTQWCPQVVKYLGLAPGSRFLIAEGYEDVWTDLRLLEV